MEQQEQKSEQQREEEPLIPHGLLPSYLAQVFGDLYEQDGLAVLGQGLQWLQLLACFSRFYADVKDGHVAIVQEELKSKNNKKQQSPTMRAAKPAISKPPLVLVLGLKDHERATLLNVLQSWGTPPELLPTMITNESGQARDRVALYQRGGVFCVTSRILIVDLLTGTASPKDIEGLLVAHAHTVTEESTNAFILRIFASQKHTLNAQSSETTDGPNDNDPPLHTGFVKAFSDAPDQLISGFAKIDKVLKALHVRNLYLYPRFHDAIRDELEGTRPPIVTEWHQELSPRQKDMQAALAAAVQACLRELKASTAAFLEWTDPALAVENCVTSHFDRAISRQLEPDWHRLKPHTKQLVQDLRTLRTLFSAVLQYDSVSFYKLLLSLKTMSAASRHASLWLLTPAADLLFRKAKERVYTIQQQQPTAAVPKPVAILQAVLEENPKWALLQKVLKEVQKDVATRKQSKEEHENDEEEDDRGPTTVLIMIKDERNLEAVKDSLVDGPRTMMLRWLRYLEQYNDRSRSIVKGGTANLSEESRLLLEEEGRVRRLLFGVGAQKSKKQQQAKHTLNQVPAHVRKRRRIAVEKGRGEWEQEDLERQAVLEEALETTEHDMANLPAARKTAKDGSVEPMFHVSYPSDELRVVLKSYTSVPGDEASLLLQDIQPDYIILFDAEVSFIRATEVYASLSTTRKEAIRVYFMIFEASAEEKTFKKALEREQSAFEKVIHHKQTMPPPSLESTYETQEVQQANRQGGVVSTYMGGTLPLAVDTRRGRGKASLKERRDVAVDVREFRSALPSILHQGGMRLAPVTLTVGDFVLSSVHCIERKSISDLFGSFASGRLYTQAEAMCKYYKCACLLIEFDPSKSFSLQNANELGVEIRMDSICTKMSLLAMHFPKLRILWARSPHETLRIFRELKTNHDEVDVDRAVEIGRNESEEALLEQQEDDEDEINEAARDMLLRMPGVNVHVARRIMQECDSLAELSALPREELRRIAGPAAGQKLFTFFRQQMGAT